MELKSFFAQTSQGAIVPGATCHLYVAGTTDLVAGLQDAAGNPLANPFQATAEGLIQFRAADGEYDLRVMSGGRDYRLPVQCLDLTAALASVEAAAQRAEQAAEEAEAAVAAWPAVLPVTVTRALALSDLGKYLRSTSAAAVSLTIEPQATVAWPANAEIHLRVAGTGAVTLVAGAGVTLAAPSGGTLQLGERMAVTLKRAAENQWDVIGQTVSA